MLAVEGSNLRLRDIAPMRAPFIPDSESIVEALRLLNQSRAPALLTTYRGQPAVLDRADIELVLPSPASSLARYEMPDLVERVKVREAVRGPAPLLSTNDTLARAVAIMREWDWRPVVVVDGHSLYGLLTAGALLTVLIKT